MTHAGWLLVDVDGTLHRCTGPARFAVPDRFGRPLGAVRDGLARVGLAPALGVTGWHADGVGGQAPNPVGACLLVSLGGPGEVVGGPVAVTGWCGETSSVESTQARVRDLDRAQVGVVEMLHHDIVTVLSGQVVDRPAGWMAEICAVAALVGSAGALPRDPDRARIVTAARDAADRYLAEDIF